MTDRKTIFTTEAGIKISRLSNDRQLKKFLSCTWQQKSLHIWTDKRKVGLDGSSEAPFCKSLQANGKRGLGLKKLSAKTEIQSSK